LDKDRFQDSYIVYSLLQRKVRVIPESIVLILLYISKLIRQQDGFADMDRFLIIMAVTVNPEACIALLNIAGQIYTKCIIKLTNAVSRGIT
jgi:hypothetical protein